MNKIDFTECPSLWNLLTLPEITDKITAYSEDIDDTIDVTKLINLARRELGI